MHKIIKYIIIIIFIVMIIAFMSISLNKTNQVILKQNPYDNIVNLDELGIVILSTNPSTGYTWRCEISDKRIIKLESSHIFIPKSTFLGQKAKQIWKFRPRNIGKTTITFKYYRDWEEKDIINQVEYTINITKK